MCDHTDTEARPSIPIRCERRHVMKSNWAHLVTVHQCHQNHDPNTSMKLEYIPTWAPLQPPQWDCNGLPVPDGSCLDEELLQTLNNPWTPGRGPDSYGKHGAQHRKQSSSQSGTSAMPQLQLLEFSPSTFGCVFLFE